MKKLELVGAEPVDTNLKFPLKTSVLSAQPATCVLAAAE